MRKPVKNKEIMWPDFETLEHRLIAANTPFSPSYIHGMMVGLLCVATRGPQMCWELLQVEVPEMVQQETTRKLFSALFTLTNQQLQDIDKAITLMLPDDAVPLTYRLEALAGWCEGFLYGVELENVSKEALMSIPNVQEVLTDLTQIKDIAFDAKDTESNERDFTEIVEFVRVGALLVHAECKQAKMNHQLLH